VAYLAFPCLPGVSGHESHGFANGQGTTPSPRPSPPQRPTTAAAGEREEKTHEPLTPGLARGYPHDALPGLSAEDAALAASLFLKKMSSLQALAPLGEGHADTE
jgi:hypothetical protein